MIRLLTIAFFLLIPVFSSAKEKTGILSCSPFPSDSVLLKSLEEKLQNGDKRALRDLATLLDYSPKVKELYLNYTIFPKEIIDFSKKLDKQTILDFYYKYQSKFVFSQLYQAFVYKNLTEIKVESKHVPFANMKTPSSRENIILIENLLENNKIDSISAILSKHTFSNSNDALPFLLSLANQKKIASFSQKQRVEFYRSLVDALSFFRKEEAFNAILQMVDKNQLPPILISWPLARLTNVFASHEVKDEQITKRYRAYHDSLKSLEAMRMFGYERYRPAMQRSYFENDVDYFGALVATAFQNDSYWWVRENALSDMLATKHPRILFYLATQAFKERNKTVRYGYSSDYFIRVINMIENWTGERVEVQDAAGNFTAEPQKDLAALKNYLVYWATHWEDYEWDEYRNSFSNKKQKLAQKEQYERLFRRFSSTNDSVAVQSYRELTEGDPAEITKLAAKYRGLLRNVNSNLPDFKYKFLEQITQLTEYCRIQKLRYAPTKQEEEIFGQLLDAPTPTIRYVIENKLIKSLTQEQITPFEYWGLLHQSKVATNFSVSRILDYWYSDHWESVLHSPSELKLYLKKSYLLTQTNSSGSATAYAKKIDMRKVDVLTRLKQIQQEESDENILAAIHLILTPTKKEEENSNQTAIPDDKNITSLVAQLASNQILSIEQLNAVTQSNAYKPAYREACLKALALVSPVEDIFQLKILPRLSIQKGELSYIEKLTFVIKDLDDFPRIVDVDNPSVLFSFIMSRAQNATIDELGSLLNNTFRASWFANYLTSGTFEATQATVLKTTLERYLNESELISEFEEQATARNIAQLEGYNKPIEERLQIAFNTTNDDDTKLKIMNEIIARISYREISKVLPFVLQMEALSGKTTIAFLHEDFGIPIFEFDNEKAIQDFLQRHKTLTERELYTVYLQKYGADFQKNNGDLDYDKIYNILKFDLVTPYTGASGNRRDDYVYGIIKVLELSLNERLGFHPKLNESQIFYSFNAAKRAHAWMNYLKEKKLINLEKHNEVMSFNNH
jgi:hypothetical protein